MPVLFVHVSYKELGNAHLEVVNDSAVCHTEVAMVGVSLHLFFVFLGRGVSSKSDCGFSLQEKFVILGSHC